MCIRDRAVTVADDNCLRAGTQHTVRDDDVLARFCPIRNAGKRNAVVAARNMAIGNNNTFTARNMDAVVVRHVGAGVNRKAKQLDILARVETERPAWRIDNLNAAHSLSLIHIYRGRSCHRHGQLQDDRRAPHSGYRQEGRRRTELRRPARLRPC